MIISITIEIDVDSDFVELTDHEENVLADQVYALTLRERNALAAEARIYAVRLLDGEQYELLEAEVKEKVKKDDD